MLQFAARTAKERGAVEEGDEITVSTTYKKLEKLVPGLLKGKDTTKDTTKDKLKEVCE